MIMRSSVLDELRLASLSLQGHDSQFGSTDRRVRTEVAPYDVEAQVQSCRGTCRRQKIPVIDVEYALIDDNFRESAREFVRDQPVGGSSESVECSGPCQYESTGANRAA